MSSEVKLRPMKMGKAAKNTTATSEAAPTMATLSHAKTCEKRNSHLHNICIHMLCQAEIGNFENFDCSSIEQFLLKLDKL